ncbi:dihydroorotase [Deltaproteobacteria bacterium]|nr:dihydroorotase [Deltaproteobacteria bacterium]
MERYDFTDVTRSPVQYDMLLKNGWVYDPETGADTTLDVAVADGKIAAVGKELCGLCYNVVDCSGKLVIPGFVDAHQHCYPSAHIGVPPETSGIYSGIPTVVDAGSAGYMTFSDFYARFMLRSATDVYALLHHHPVGLYAQGQECWTPEMVKVQDARTVETVETYRDRILGIKTRMVESFLVNSGLAGLDTLIKLCERCKLPLTVHVGDTYSNGVSDGALDAFTVGLLERLRPGDIIAHAFTNKRGALFREDGKHDNLMQKVVERGILLDASPGQTNFSRSRFARAFNRGFKPNIISSDYGLISMNGVNRNFGLCLSRFLAVGLSVREVVAMAVGAPAKALGLEDRKGSLRVGREADISVIDIQRGNYIFMDHGKGETFSGEQFLAPVFTVRKGLMYSVIHSGYEPITV